MVKSTLPIVLLGEPDAATGQFRRELDHTGKVMVVGMAGDLQGSLRLVRERHPAAALVKVTNRASVAVVEALMRELPLPIVVLARTRELGTEALAVGALEALPPDAPVRTTVETLVLMSRLKVVGVRHDGGAPKAPGAHGKRAAAKPPLVAIGASTGGPVALAELLGKLPTDLPAPVLVAQHMPSDYDQTFAAWLGSVTPLPVVVGVNQHLRPGTVYLAPSACNLVLGPGGVLETRLADPKQPIPSVDVLFESVAQTSAWALCGVVLSGMGSDGAAGLLAIRRAGGFTLVQDRKTSVVFSMPEEALARGASEISLPPLLLGHEVLQWARSQATRAAQHAHDRVARNGVA